MRAFLLASILAIAPARAQIAVEIGQAGVIEPEGVGGPSTPPEGDNLVGSSPAKWKRFTHLGPDVDAKFCMLFGFQFRAPDLPPPLAFPVTVQLDHPLWTRPDGRTGTRERYTNVLSSEWSYAGYELDESWTLVPGTWRFTVLVGHTVLATQSFELSVAPGQTLGPDGCAPRVA